MVALQQGTHRWRLHFCRRRASGHSGSFGVYLSILKRRYEEPEKDEALLNAVKIVLQEQRLKPPLEGANAPIAHRSAELTTKPAWTISATT